MQVDSLQRFFASSPAVRLIRSPHAFWIVDFLLQQFKCAGQITCRHAQLSVELDRYLDQLKKSRLGEELKLDSRDKADTYLSNWCSTGTGWLKRFIDEDSSDVSYQLTSELEKVLSFVERSSRQWAFYGTESRLRSILDTLDELVAGSHADPEVRIQQLRNQKSRIEQEIASIQASSDFAKLGPTQVVERFALAAQQLQQLQSEFRGVEERFRSITRDVQQRILSAADTRGDILQFALDSEDLLKQGDQGKSFFEFLKLVHSPESQDRMALLVRQLENMAELAGEQQDLSAFRQMLPNLISEAEKILRTTQHLSQTLRKLLDNRSTRHHQQLAHLLRDILAEAARQSEQPPLDMCLDLEVELEIQSPMERPFWTSLEPFDEVELQPVCVDPMERQLAFEKLAAMERLDWKALRRNISSLTERQDQVTLEAVLDRFPIQGGVVEVLGYLQIAYEDGHRIDRRDTVELPASSTGRYGRSLRLPRIVFLSSVLRKDRLPSSENFGEQSELFSSPFSSERKIAPR